MCVTPCPAGGPTRSTLSSAAPAPAGGPPVRRPHRLPQRRQRAPRDDACGGGRSATPAPRRRLGPGGPAWRPATRERRSRWPAEAEKARGREGRGGEKLAPPWLGG